MVDGAVRHSLEQNGDGFEIVKVLPELFQGVAVYGVAEVDNEIRAGLVEILKGGSKLREGLAEGSSSFFVNQGSVDHALRYTTYGSFRTGVLDICHDSKLEERGSLSFREGIEEAL